MTNDVLPNSRGQPSDAQEQLVPQGYEDLDVLDAVTAILWEHRLSGRFCFSREPWTYTRCRENVHSYLLIVGGFAPRGLCVLHNYRDCAEVGIAAWRKF